MGKSLIIKGADFSASGYKYTLVTEDVTTLKDYQGNTISSYADLYNVTTSQGLYVYANDRSGTTSSTGTNYAKIGATDFIDLQDFQFIDYIGFCPALNNTTMSFGLLFFYSRANLDSLIPGSYGSALNPNSGTTITDIQGPVTSLSDIPIPADARYVRCTQYYVSGYTGEFKLTLKKYVVTPTP